MLRRASLVTLPESSLHPPTHSQVGLSNASGTGRNPKLRRTFHSVQNIQEEELWKLQQKEKQARWEEHAQAARESEKEERARLAAEREVRQQREAAERAQREREEAERRRQEQQRQQVRSGLESSPNRTKILEIAELENVSGYSNFIIKS